LDLHREAAESPLVTGEQRLPGAQIELPVVPRAADHGVFEAVVERPGLRRQHRARDDTATDGRLLMRTHVAVREEVASDIEDADRASFGLDDARRTHRQLVEPADGMANSFGLA